MRILAIDTSTMTGGVAVMDGDRGLLAETRARVRTGHSGSLMPEVDQALGRASLAITDIDALCVTTGPGSFTGLRIGLSTAKGLCFSTGLPLVAVPTLEAFAWNFPLSRAPVCPMLDARKKEVYAAVFLMGGGGAERLMPEASVRPADLVRELAGHDEVVLAGQGAELYREVFAGALGRRAVFAPPHLSEPLPSAAAALGLQKALRGEFSEPRGLSPFYIRKSEAELKKR
ncbi:MAG: tRNA (adenosine(37)-N6)-threonylcarbamoyltransferase complex dimerization subunit type 1 TsaB [Nitrospirota bacterium]|jgi:tRNA threonylcarbamoyladenosine biosynthesis protein TsaB